jgi:hypothetical protein
MRTARHKQLRSTHGKMRKWGRSVTCSMPMLSSHYAPFFGCHLLPHSHISLKGIKVVLSYTSHLSMATMPGPRQRSNEHHAVLMEATAGLPRGHHRGPQPTRSIMGLEPGSRRTTVLRLSVAHA